jgi:ribosome assembly protein SQT1
VWSYGENQEVDATTSVELGGHTDSVVAANFSYDGTLLATAGYDGTVKIWDAAADSNAATLRHSLEGPEDIEFIDWHSKGNVVMAGSGDGTTWMWLATTGACMAVFAGHEGAVTCGAFTPNGKVICTGSADSTVRLWAPRTGALKHTFQGCHEAPVNTLVCHSDESSGLVLSGSQDGTACLLHVGSKRVLGSVTHAANSNAEGAVAVVGGASSAEGTGASSVEGVGFANSHAWFGTCSLDHTARIWDTNTQQCRQVLRHTDGVIRLRWHPTAPLLHTLATDGTLSVWDARSGETVRSFTGHANMPVDLDLQVDADGNTHAVTACEDGVVRVFDCTIR